MTATTSASGTAEPIGEVNGAPLYAAGQAPEHLMTQDTLKEQRLRPARGQRPAAYVNDHPDADSGATRFTRLYNPADAERMRPLSPGQQRDMTARRTCPECGTVGTEPIPRTTGRCEDCAAKAHRQHVEQKMRACTGCGRPATRPYPAERRRCDACALQYALWELAEADRRATWARTCPGPGEGRPCEAVTAVDDEISAHVAEHGWWRPRSCDPCTAELERRADEAERSWQEAELDPVGHRRREVAAVQAWARSVLADTAAVVLDTETTGTGPDARIVEITVLSPAGEVLLDTLIDPGVPKATAVHGIRDADVAGAPTLGDILPHLTNLVRAASRVVVYNASFDKGRLRHELHLHHQARATDGHIAGDGDLHPAADALVESVRWECAMRAYAVWFGERHDYGDGYRWQALGGGHRALGDCRAVIDRLTRMLDDPPEHDPDDGYW